MTYDFHDQKTRYFRTQFNAWVNWDENIRLSEKFDKLLWILNWTEGYIKRNPTSRIVPNENFPSRKACTYSSYFQTR